MKWGIFNAGPKYPKYVSLDLGPVDVPNLTIDPTWMLQHSVPPENTSRDGYTHTIDYRWGGSDSERDHRSTLCIRTMQGNCGVAEISGMYYLFDKQPREFDTYITEYLKYHGYTKVIAGVAMEAAATVAKTLGWTQFTSFVNRRTKNTCYLLEKSL